MSSYKNYQCVNEPCLACGDWSAQRCYHHIVTRKSGGVDEPWNLMPLDLHHHNEVHQLGLSRFARKYINVEKWLIRNGWAYDLFREKWIHLNEGVL